MGNEAIKAIGAACQISSSRPLQAIGAFPKKFWSRIVGRHSHTPSVSNPPPRVLVVPSSVLLMSYDVERRRYVAHNVSVDQSKLVVVEAA